MTTQTAAQTTVGLNDPRAPSQKTVGGNELQRLMPRHFKILELSLDGLYNVKDIANAMDMTPQAVSLITKSPLFQGELARRREHREKASDELAVGTAHSALEKLQGAAVDAAETQIGLLASPDERVAQASAKDILDRVLPKKTEGNVGAVIIAPGQLNILNVALAESENGRKFLDAGKEPAKT